MRKGHFGTDERCETDLIYAFLARNTEISQASFLPRGILYFVSCFGHKQLLEEGCQNSPM